MAAAQTKAPAAFLSYAHRDDRFGEVTRLRERLAHAVSVALGQDFEIFQDRDGIAWGQHWPDRLDEALEQAVFLIPILSPSYFASEPCRAELEKFLELERRTGRRDLILPVYFRTAPACEDKSDALAALLSERQYRDWRDLRHKPIDAPEVIQRLDQLADEIEAAVRRPAVPAKDGGEPAPPPEGEGIAEGPPEHLPPAERPPDLELIEGERRVVRNAALRAEPSLAADIVTRLKIGALVYVAGRARDSGWLRIEEDNLRGYVVADAVEPLEASTPQQSGHGEMQQRDQPADETEAVAGQPPKHDTGEPVPASEGAGGSSKRLPVPERLHGAKRLMVWSIAGSAGVAVVGTALWLAVSAPVPKIASDLQRPGGAIGVPADARVIELSGDYPEPGSVFKDCPDCPEMVVLPGGSFLMGSPEEDNGRYDTEGPQREVTITPFAIGKYEVTFEEWDACVEAGGCSHKPDDGNWGRGRLPVINVSWHDAQAYAAWLRGPTGKSYRLPSEAEWEYATRAGTTTRYWWGDGIAADRANYDGNIGRTVEVGSYPANLWGVHDTHGNVWEWVEDRWHDNYEGAPTDGWAWLEGASTTRVIRGGSWSNYPRDLRSASRDWKATNNRRNDLGFRVFRMLTP